MRSNPGSDREATRDSTRGADATGQPSWPLALASVGVCLGSGAAIALIAFA